MIALPVCRWRKEYTQDHYICHSTRFVNSPNLIHGRQCTGCAYADKEAPALPRVLPCVHLGDKLADSAAPNGVQSIFACALHRSCSTAENTQEQNGIRSCSSCLDYLAREPFGATSMQMLRASEAFLAAIPDYPKDCYKGRGVVIAGGGDKFFPSLYITVRALRHSGCRLPLQVWYFGSKKEMPKKNQVLLAPYQVEFADADAIRLSHPARRWGGWEVKVFATLHSSFEEILFLDADCYPCRNPDFLFDLEDYRSRGAIFWPDIMLRDQRLKWYAFGLPGPRSLGSVESGQFVINKKQCWQPLNLAWFYNDHSDYYYRYGFGDKHTFEVAWARCQQPFVMWETKAHWDEVAYIHWGPDNFPLFVHRCRDKFRFGNYDYNTPQAHSLPTYYSSLPLERECWGWLAELARIKGCSLDNGTTKIQRYSGHRPSNRIRFAVATLYTPDIAAVGKRTSKVLTAYAKRHGYDAVVATASIDASRPPAWSKLLLIERYLTENPDCVWLMWIDADAVITNPTQRLEDLVDDEVDFLVAEDLAPRPINTGVFLVRNCPAALEMLRRAYDKGKYTFHPMWEQPALAEALRECFDIVRIRVVSRRLLNSLTHEHQKGDFIIHFAGASAEEKLAGVKKAIATAMKP